MRNFNRHIKELQKAKIQIFCKGPLLNDDRLQARKQFKLDELEHKLDDIESNGMKDVYELFKNEKRPQS